MRPLNLSHVPSRFREQVAAEIKEGNPDAALWAIDNTDALQFVRDNAVALVQRGLFEPMLLRAYVGSRTNNLGWRQRDLEALFRLCDRRRLLEAGDSLRPGRTLTIYRGIAGVGADRRPKGMSWTTNREQAEWFANRFGLPNPEVIEGRIGSRSVLAYTEGRQEQEVICFPRAVSIIERHPLTLQRV
jgi:hypothetical protein